MWRPRDVESLADVPEADKNEGLWVRELKSMKMYIWHQGGFKELKTDARLTILAGEDGGILNERDSKAWKDMVSQAHSEPWQSAILAADAELKRLRDKLSNAEFASEQVYFANEDLAREVKRLSEAIEWATTLNGGYTDQVFRSNGYWCMFRDELLRRAALMAVEEREPREKPRRNQ